MTLEEFFALFKQLNELADHGSEDNMWAMQRQVDAILKPLGHTTTVDSERECFAIVPGNSTGYDN